MGTREDELGRGPETASRSVCEVVIEARVSCRGHTLVRVRRGGMDNAFVEKTVASLGDITMWAA